VGNVSTNNQSKVNSNYSNETTSHEWYHDGTLHEASIFEWKSASYENQLATAGDILAGTAWKDQINSASDMDEIKIEAESLVNEINIATIDNGLVNNTTVALIAAMIISQRNDFGPNN